LNLGLLAGAFELSPGGVELLPRGAQLPHEDGEIEEARHDQQEGAAEGE
jgi:hypothetical protein